MKEIFERIWDEALPYQDKREDEGHAKHVMDFAFQLLENIDADEDIVIPAAILHDIGWSQLSDEDRFYVFKNKIQTVDEMKMKEKVPVRVLHEKEGVKLARKILSKVGYDEDKSEKILKIIAQHDTGKGTLNQEDAVMKDADKLWTFSHVGIDADVRRFKKDYGTFLDEAEDRIDLQGYFRTEAAKNIARRELEKRKNGIN